MSDRSPPTFPFSVAGPFPFSVAGPSSLNPPRAPLANWQGARKEGGIGLSTRAAEPGKLGSPCMCPCTQGKRPLFIQPLQVLKK